MKNTIEMLHPQVVDCALSSNGESIILKSLKSDKHLQFPSDAEDYIKKFIAGLSLQEIIHEGRKAGENIDFKQLKECLATLYWGRFLKNSKEFSKHIEFPEWVPVERPSLKAPWLSIEVDDQPPLLRIFYYLLPIGLFLLVSNFLLQLSPGQTDWTAALAVLLIPQSALILKGIFSAVISAVFHQSPQSLAVHVSAFGIYPEESSSHPVKIGLFEALVRTTCYAFLFGSAFYFCVQSENPLIYSFGPLAILLVLSQSFVPGKHGEFGDLVRLLSEPDLRPVQRWGSIALYIGWTMVSVIVSLIFIASVSKLLYFHARDWAFTNLDWDYILTVVAVMGLYPVTKDLWDGMKFMHYHLGELVNAGSKRDQMTVPKTRDDLIGLLKKIPPFEFLSPEVLRSVSKHAKLKKFPAGARVFKQGDSSTELYVLIQGEVRVVRRDAQGQKVPIVSLKQGSVFGEGGFFLRHARTADCVCTKTSIVIQIGHTPDAAGSQPHQFEHAEDFQQRIWALQAMISSDMFKNVPHEAIMSLIYQGELKRVPERSVVLKAGDQADALYVIIEGSCRVESDGSFVRNLETRSIFGEIGILWNTRRTHTVTTAEHCLLLKLSSSVIWGMLEHNIDFGIALQSLGQRRIQDSLRPAS
ncbi:MAG: cyclic nucleotide-binding domain-containing protein [Oligoflexia bacterium]|nr:cyclic nucleotide-binding domain-containing protein [Oligoflexia bacterium]